MTPKQAFRLAKAAQVRKEERRQQLAEAAFEQSTMGKMFARMRAGEMLRIRLPQDYYSGIELK